VEQIIARRNGGQMNRRSKVKERELEMKLEESNMKEAASKES